MYWKVREVIDGKRCYAPGNSKIKHHILTSGFTIIMYIFPLQVTIPLGIQTAFWQARVFEIDFRRFGGNSEYLNGGSGDTKNFPNRLRLSWEKNTLANM